jgi:hypothetical protein
LADIWCVALTCVRISILDVYLTIFSIPKFKKIVYAVMFLQLLGMAAEFMLDHLVHDQTAPIARRTYIAAHVVFLTCDLSIAILPIPLVWNLQMSLGTRIAICSLFGLGARYVESHCHGSRAYN